MFLQRAHAAPLAHFPEDDGGNRVRAEDSRTSAKAAPGSQRLPAPPPGSISLPFAPGAYEGSGCSRRRFPVPGRGWRDYCRPDLRQARTKRGRSEARRNGRAGLGGWKDPPRRLRKATPAAAARPLPRRGKLQTWTGKDARGAQRGRRGRDARSEQEPRPRGGLRWSVGRSGRSLMRSSP